MSRGNDIGVDRRKLMQTMGAAGAIGFTAGCSTGGTPTETEPATEQGTPTPSPTPTRTPTPKPLQHGGTFIEGTTSTSRAINALRVGDGTTANRVYHLFDGGFDRESPQYEDITPFWFEDINVADSLDVLTIKLRDNLNYSNPYGELTAEDYMWNMENIWKSSAEWYNFTYSYLFNVGKNNEPINFVKEGKRTIREELPEPRPFFPYGEPLGGFVPVPKQIVKPYLKKKDAKGLNQDDQIRLSTYNGNLGPWDLTEYKPSAVVAYERADDYYLREVAEEDDRVPDVWAEAPYFDNLKIQHFSKDSTAQQALKAGEIDRYGIPATKLSQFKNAKNLFIYTNPYIAYSDYLGMNHRVNGWEGLRNKKVRHAVSNLYDNNFVVENLLNGKGSVQDTLHPQWGPYYPPEDQLFKDEGKLKKAKKLLEEGTSSDWGYSGDTFVGPDGEQLELKLVYVQGTTDDLRASYTKERFKKAGIKVNLVSTSWASLITKYFYTNKRAEGVPKDANIGYGPEGKKHPAIYNYGPWDKAVSAKDWDLMHTLGFAYGPLDPAGTVAALFGERETFNAYGYVPSKSLVELRDKAKSAKSIEAARDTVIDMMSLISKERPVAYESNYFSYTGYRDDVRGTPESPAASYFTDQNVDLMAFEGGKSGRK